MSWFNPFKKDKPSREAGAVAPATAAPRATTRAKAEAPLSGYGNNPYDTYTWELHTDPEGERELKRAHVIDRPKPEGESFNPYDTGKFSGGW